MLAFTLLSCKVEPEPIQYGKDGCSHCRMTLVDKKFGAELVTSKGKIYKFDDVNCMLSLYNSNEFTHEDFTYILVVDFQQPGKLIDARDAFYLKSSAINSPMASQVAAFEKKESMEAVQKQNEGIYMVWGELVTQFK
jgi:copper chaperone NosL